MNEYAKTFESSINTINANTEWLVDNVFKTHLERGTITDIFYPKLMNKFNYDILTTPSTKGYGDGFNVVFQMRKRPRNSITTWI